MPAQTLTELFDQLDEPAAQRVAIADVLREGRLGADRFSLPIRHDGAIVEPVRELAHVPADFAEVIGEDLLRSVRELADGHDAQAMQASFGFGADAPHAADRQEC